MAKKKDHGEIVVRVRNWAAYKGRKDNLHNSWFRCSNRILEDQDFYTFTSEEKLVWIYILCVSSQKNSDIIKISVTHAERACGIKPASVYSAIEKLKLNQLLPLEDTSELLESNLEGPVSNLQVPASNPQVTRKCATNKQTNKQTEKQFAEALSIYSFSTSGPGAEKRYREQIRSDEDHEQLLVALKNYKAMLEIETWRHPKTSFAAFLGPTKEPFWRSFIEWRPPVSRSESPQVLTI